MYTKDLISIIIPCYNVGDYLAETLESVLAQTYSNWECIIVNDGSSDNTKEIAKEYSCKDKRIKAIEQPNSGVSVARNNGIKKSNGEFILPLDGDDLLDNTFLEKTFQYINEHKDTKLVYTKVEMFGAITGEFVLSQYNYKNFIWGNCIVVTALFKHSDFDKTNGFNPNMRNGLEDWDFWLAFLGENDIVHRIEEPLLKYRIRKNSRTRTTANANEQEILRQIYKNHEERYRPYLGNILVYKTIAMRHENEIKKLEFKLKMEYMDILNSTNYRLGKFLLSPLRWIKKIFGK